MKIGLAQINPTVGNLEGNRRLIIDAYDQLKKEGANLIVFPELVVSGYPPRDLIFKSRFVADNEDSLKIIAHGVGDVPAIIGFVEEDKRDSGRQFYNAAAWCYRGAIAGVARKCLLPTYDVFDEDRYFEAAPEPTVIEHEGMRIGITICEDIWIHPEAPPHSRYDVDPLDLLAASGIGLLVNLSASPWHFGKGALREDLVKSAARRCSCPVVYCNAVGGNDELIFDGHSMVAGSDARLLAGLAGFEEELRVVDLDQKEPTFSLSFRQESMGDIHDALVIGLRDYAHKSGFDRALLGLSGGIDSSVTAVLAVHALGANNVIGISLPSAISSQHSRDDAAILARNLGIEYHTLPIANIVSASEATLKEIFEGLERDVTEENVQARSRGLLLMAVSNKLGALLLTTGNKSELAVGYCTLYGDMCGGLAVISDLPKVNVYELAQWINGDGEIIPANTLTKPPSAELSPDQKDEDSLPPYDVLDRILEMYVENGSSSSEIVDAGFDRAVVCDIIRKVDLNEYKRKQAAPGLKITPLAFGVGRRIPLVQRYVS